MESYKSNADNTTFNGTFNAATTSAPATVPRDGSTTVSMVDTIMSEIQELLAAYEELGQSNCAPFSANAGSGERMADVVNSSTQTMIPTESYKSNADNSTFNGTTTESMVDGLSSQIQEFQAAYQKLGHEIENKVSGVLLEFIDCMKKVNAGLEVDVFYSRIKLHKYESAKSCLENKEHCCICLVDYCGGEKLAEIDCGHIYHVNCIKEWSKLKTSCPICERDALAILT